MLKRAHDRGNRGDPLRGVRRVADAKEPAAARVPTRRIDAVHQARLLPNLLPEHGAVPAAQHGGEQIQHRRIGVGQAWNRPGERAAGEFDFFKAMQFTRGQLHRLGRHQHRGQPHAGGRAEVLLHQNPGRSQIHVAHDHHHEIVGHVALTVITHEILAGDRRKHIAMPDDRLAVGMLTKRCPKQRIPKPVLGFILRHRDFPQNHVFLFRRLVGRQRGV